MIFLVIFISSIIAFFLRILDIFITFWENGIRLSFVQSIIVFLIFLKVFKNATKTCIKKKDWKGVKKILILYLFEFQTFLVFISCFTYEAAKVSGIKIPGKTYEDSSKKQIKSTGKSKDLLLLINVIKKAIKEFGSKHPTFSFD